MKNFLIYIFLTCFFLSHSQTDLNDYKYVIVPKKFDVFKNENQYQTSTLIKFLFTQKGFNTIYDDAIPDDLKERSCLGLRAELIDNSSMFSTKMEIHLKDCNSQKVFGTKEGVSKIKEFKGAYHEAIRKAFSSFNGITYYYTPKKNTANPEPVTVSFRNDVKKLDPIESATKEVPESNVEQSVPQVVPNPEEIINTSESKEDVLNENIETLDSAVSDRSADEVLYAQEIRNGYQLVDSAPKILLKIFNSSVQGFYIAQAEGRNGIVYNKGGKWFFEYYKGEQLVSEELNIKF